MRLIDADELKGAIEDRIGHIPSNDYDQGWNAAINTAIDEIDNAPAVNDCPNCEYKLEADYIRSSSSYKELIALRKFKEENTRPQGKWYDYVEDSLLKARHGKHVIYDVDYLLDHLAQEVNIMETVRRMRDREI